MEDTVIEFKNVSKRYFIGEHSIRTLREDLGRFVSRVFGQNGENKKEIWALKDINFAITRGESVGLIGPNGSGKTTIFKLISRITFPTKGKVSVKSRIGSLIDLSAGFHPSLTGLENIYLNAAIRGMKRKDIKRRAGEILEFAEIERFKDTPVRHYSSGMLVRLGFAVSVFCPSDILLIDEAIAVGDLRFQERCLNKIRELHKAGKTILFVSHEVEKVKQICLRVLYLSYGNIVADTIASEAISTYLNNSSTNDKN